MQHRELGQSRTEMPWQTILTWHFYSKPDGTLMLALEKEHLENEALLEKLRKVADISQDISE